MILHITIPCGDSTKVDLLVRHTLIDTIEEREIGHVIDCGTGEEAMHVAIQVAEGKKGSELEIRSLLDSLGLVGSQVKHART